MKTRFTSGPWFKSQIMDDGRWGIITGNNEIIIGCSQNLTKENAAMVAASTELYEALDALLASLIGSSDPKTLVEVNAYHALRKARDE